MYNFVLVLACATSPRRNCTIDMSYPVLPLLPDPPDIQILYCPILLVEISQLFPFLPLLTDTSATACSIYPKQTQYRMLVLTCPTSPSRYFFCNLLLSYLSQQIFLLWHVLLFQANTHILNFPIFLQIHMIQCVLPFPAGTLHVLTFLTNSHVLTFPNVLPSSTPSKKTGSANPSWCLWWQ